MIDVQNLSKRYGPVRAVEQVSFSVNPGEVVGLLGPNGAGKSTTLRVLTGFLPPTSGRVRVGGWDVLDNPLESRQKIGYLSENNPLYESLGVWECLEMTGRLRGMESGFLAQRLRRVVEECSLGSVISKDVGELSKGFRQRLGLAQAILHDPEVLILDEPTSGLDPNQQNEVHDLILALKQKKTVLLSTHILPDAQTLCDSLLIIHQGRIVARGTPGGLGGGEAGEESFYVRLKGRRDELEEALKGIPGATRVEWVDEKETGCPGFRFGGAGDLREALFGLVAQKRWVVMELRPWASSLEAVFRSLTQPSGPVQTESSYGTKGNHETI